MFQKVSYVGGSVSKVTKSVFLVGVMSTQKEKDRERVTLAEAALSSARAPAVALAKFPS